MMASSHMMIGFASGIVAAKVMSDAGYDPWGHTWNQVYSMYAVAGLSAMFGALVPDIDLRESKIGRALPFISFFVSKICEHRGATHSMVMILATAWLILKFAHGLWLFAGTMFTIGMLSHILSDMPCGGVQFFWPLSRNRFGARLFRTGDMIENVISVSVFIFSVTYIAWPIVHPLIREIV